MRLSRALPALVLLAAPLRLVQAQGPSCSIDLSKPKAVAQAATAVDQAQALGANAALAQRSLKEAMGALQDPKKVAGNPEAVALLRAQIYLLWLEQPGLGEIVTNEQLNASGVKSATVNLIEASDAEFRSVEGARPDCRAKISQFRTSKAWVDRIQKGYAALDAGQIDSAAYWIDRSATLNPRSPWTLRAQAELADRRGRPFELLALLQRAITEATSDTSFARLAQDMRVRLAIAADEQSAQQQGAVKDSLRTLAVATFARLLADNPTSNLGNFAFQRATQALQLAQDSVGLRAFTAPILAEPARFSEDVLLQAAVVARIAQRRSDAIALFEGARSKNPYNRDANYNLALLYFEAAQAELMRPVVERSLEIDPVNAEVAQLRSLLLGLQFDAEKVPEKKRDLKARQAAAEELATRMVATQRVLISQLDRRDSGMVMKGTIENLSDAPRSYVLGIEFIDARGIALDSASVEVPNVAPAKEGTFTVSSNTPGVVAYRFKPMSPPPAAAAPKSAPTRPAGATRPAAPARRP